MKSEDLSRGDYVKAIFGNSHRLDIWARIARHSIDPPERFYVKGLLEDLDGVVGNILGNEMQNLKRLGMIERNHDGGLREGQIGGQLPKWFVRCDSPAWQIVETALQVVEVEFPSPAS